MAGPLKGEVHLSFEGKQLTLVLDFNALCEFEAQIGEGAQARMMLIEQGKGTFSDMRALLWAMLQTHHPEIDLKTAGQIIGANLDDAGAAFGKAFEAAFPDGGKKPKAIRTKTRAGKTSQGR
ncbi:GTA-gp10 family protein [Albirhodobacter sp. R86504]|uniref:GTA-gp10 family protein n=1 Tax=Albirhodobacter sp. R86504 TaxID=3093848 RepID=UPI0036720C99